MKTITNFINQKHQLEKINKLLKKKGTNTIALLKLKNKLFEELYNFHPLNKKP